MKPKIIIISFTVIVGTILSFYIMVQESKGTNEFDLQVANRGETKVKLKGSCYVL